MSSHSRSQEDLPAWLRDETGEVVAEPTKIEPTHSSGLAARGNYAARA